MSRTTTRRASRSALLTVALCGVLTLTGLGAASAAAPGETAAPNDPVEITNTASGARAAADYWTPERIAEATPLVPSQSTGPATATLEPPAATSLASGSAEPTLPTAPPLQAATDAVSPLAIGLPSSVGILYFTDASGASKYCTASVINSATDNVITTSGACVYGMGGNAWHTNFVFYPQSYNGSAPRGTFTWANARTTQAWTSSRNESYNYAFIRLNARADGLSVEAAAGSQGYSYGGSQARATVFWGYTSQVPYYCQTTSYALVTNQQNGLNCVIGAGSGGGPWLSSYDTNTNLGYVFCVTGNFSGGTTRCSYQSQDWYNLFSTF